MIFLFNYPPISSSTRSNCRAGSMWLPPPKDKVKFVSNGCSGSLAAQISSTVYRDHVESLPLKVRHIIVELLALIETREPQFVALGLGTYLMPRCLTYEQPPGRQFYSGRELIRRQQVRTRGQFFTGFQDHPC